MAALRIYADYNGLGRWGSSRLAIPLDTFGSLQDLTNAGVRLRDGLSLVVVDASDEAEDLEAEATARYDAAAGWWLAVLGPAGYRYVPKGDRTPDHHFLCFGCRRDLAAGLPPERYGHPREGACPDCGTPIAAAVAPPDGAVAHQDPAT